MRAAGTWLRGAAFRRARSVPHRASLWRTVYTFRRHLVKQWRLAGLAMLSLLGEVALRLLEPWPLKFVFDRIFAAGTPLVDPVGIDAVPSTLLLALCAIGLLAVTGLRALASYRSTVGFAIIGNRVLTAIRAELFRHLQTLSLSYHGRAKQGDLVVRVINDVGVLKEVVVTAFLPLVGNMLILGGMVAVMLWLDWQLVMLVLIVVPLFWLRSSTSGSAIKDVSRKQKKREGLMAATASESIGAIKAVQALSLESSFSRAFEGQNEKNLREDVKAKRLTAGLERSFDVLIAVATAIVLFAGARSVLAGRMTPGDLLVFLTYLKFAFQPLRNFAKYTGRMAKASAAGQRILDVLAVAPEITDRPGAVVASWLEGELSVRNVSFAYDGQGRALEGVSFDVRAGQSVAVVGPSGSGKSTLVSLLLRLYDPETGSILIDGRDVRDYTISSLRQQMSVVLQDDLLFALSVRDNIALGRPDASDKEIRFASRQAQAHEFIEALPEGYDTVLAERGSTLSGGQRRRLSLARAIVRGAPILLLDEPTTGLDERSERELTDSLQDLMRGTTSIVVTHNLKLAARSDVVVYLEEGRVREVGSHHVLLQKNGRYAASYRAQLGFAPHRAADPEVVHARP
ncbi:ABC transporter ATP-binding protein [soil metagenome]